MEPDPLPFVTRVWFAWACFFRVLFDGAFAARAFAVRDAMPALPPAPPPEPKGAKTATGDRSAKAAKAAEPGESDSAEKSAKVEAPEPIAAAVKPKAKPAEPEKPNVTSALQLLAAFQREGRLVDFLEQDVASFPDADVGAAARVVHEGCRKALRQHAKIRAVRSEEEGASVTIPDGYDAHEVKLIGDVKGKPPYKGKLQHRGWKVIEMSVPTPTVDHDATVIAPAEVEL